MSNPCLIPVITTHFSCTSLHSHTELLIFLRQILLLLPTYSYLQLISVSNDGKMLAWKLDKDKGQLKPIGGSVHDSTSHAACTLVPIPLMIF